jgi:hypothetical protein
LAFGKAFAGLLSPFEATTVTDISVTIRLSLVVNTQSPRELIDLMIMRSERRASNELSSIDRLLGSIDGVLT